MRIRKIKLGESGGIVILVNISSYNVDCGAVNLNRNSYFREKNGVDRRVLQKNRKLKGEHFTEI